MWMFAAGAALAQDVNCNGIHAEDEPLVDVADPVCAANIDPKTGLPFETADRYYDYFTFGCNRLLDDSFDIDADGFGTGLVVVGPAQTQLVCDNCPSTNNPDQADTNFDGIGNACVDQLYLGWPNPGLAGMPNEVQLLFGTGLANVKIAMSTSLGTQAVPGCGGVTLDLNAPTRFDALAFSPVGTASATRNVPIALAGQTVFFQAVEPSTCRVSNVVAWTF